MLRPTRIYISTHTSHIHFIYLGHYHVISPVIMRTALLRWLACLFVSVSSSQYMLEM